MVRKIKAKLVLRLHDEGLSGRAIAAAQGVSRNSVAAVLDAAEVAGVGYRDVADRSDGDVYEMLFPGRGEHQSVFTQPDWRDVHHQLARVGVTLKLLHSEYADATTAGGGVVMGYDRYCRSYRHYLAVTGATSRVGHKAAMTIEVDWSGPTMRIADPGSGGTATVYLFVACLPFSRYAFVYPALDMRQDTWGRAHVAMFEFFGGSTPRIVCDNLKTGVIAHPREGEIVLNDSYRELATHYCAAVLPGRVRAPKDKASVENTVGHVARAVIAPLRNQVFASLGELRAAVTGRVEAYNRKPFQKRAGSRWSVFTAEEAPLLHPLPAVPFEIATWVRNRRVGRDCHVVWVRNRYSVPHTHIGDHVDLRVTDTTVEIWSNDTRVSSHQVFPAGVVNQYRTRPGDLPDGHAWRPWDQGRVREWAARIGVNTTLVVDRIFESVTILEAGLDPALAVLRLTHRYPPSRVEESCRIALSTGLHSPRYAHIRPILATGQDQSWRGGTDAGPGGVWGKGDGSDGSSWREPTGFVRGAGYYAGGER